MLNTYDSDHPSDTHGPPPHSESRSHHHLPPAPMTAPTPPPTFTTIIDADHAAINATALQLSTLLRTPLPLSSPSATHTLLTQQLALLHTVTWRLIRHDLSEELIMRPAFVRHLGPVAGTQAAEHDRADHENARVTLLQLYSAFQQCDPTDVHGRAELVRRYGALMRELAEHMRRESGEELPAMEARLGREESEELGRRYAETLVMEPGLCIGGRRVWRDVAEFVGTGKERMMEVWAAVVKEREREVEREGRRGGGKL